MEAAASVGDGLAVGDKTCWARWTFVALGQPAADGVTLARA